MSSPSIRGNHIFFGNNDNGIFALDAANGAELWKIQALGLVTTAPAVGASSVYVTGMDGIIRSIK